MVCQTPSLLCCLLLNQMLNMFPKVELTRMVGCAHIVEGKVIRWTHVERKMVFLANCRINTVLLQLLAHASENDHASVQEFTPTTDAPLQLTSQQNDQIGQFLQYMLHEKDNHVDAHVNMEGTFDTLMTDH